MLRPHTEFLFDLSGANGLIFHRIQHGDFFSDQLHQVFIRTNNGHPRALRFGLARIGRDQVIGLIPVQFDRRRPKGAGRVTGQRELWHQLLGRRPAIGFIVRIDFFAERLFRGIENNGKMRWSVFVLLVLQHLK